MKFRTYFWASLRTPLLVALSLVLMMSSFAAGHDKKKSAQRGMLESMQSVPCGAKERGLTGVGSVFGSVGVQHVNSQEQLCPQYLLRTDDMEYHIRPMDKKHAAVLPIGHEAEFKVKKDQLLLKVVDGDKKEKHYQVVSMQPLNAGKDADSKGDSAAYHSADRPPDSRPPAASNNNPQVGAPASNASAGPPPADGSRVNSSSNEHPPQ